MPRPSFLDRFLPCVIPLGSVLLIGGGCILSHNSMARDAALRAERNREIAAKCPGAGWVPAASGGGLLSGGRIEWRCKHCGVPLND